jgi:hypothetical protein
MESSVCRTPGHTCNTLRTESQVRKLNLFFPGIFLPPFDYGTLY